MFITMMKLVCTLLWFIFMFSVSLGSAAGTADLSYQSCAQQALRKKSPPERDHAKLTCLERVRGISFSKCLSEARKMEYLSSTQEALKSCYYGRPNIWNAKSCLEVARRLYTSLDRDNMRLDCLSQLESKEISRASCLRVTRSFEQLHYRERFEQVCQEK